MKSLTAKNLLKEIRRISKDKGYTQVWTCNCGIFVCKEKGHRAVNIVSKETLDNWYQTLHVRCSLSYYTYSWITKTLYNLLFYTRTSEAWQKIKNCILLDQPNFIVNFIMLTETWRLESKIYFTTTVTTIEMTE